MDNTIRQITDFTSRFRYEDLSPDVVHDCKRRIIDAVGCAFGSYDAIPVKIARTRALNVSCHSGARIMGTQHRSSVEHAAFANGVMIRYLDGNDTYSGGGAGHPSDILGAVLTVGDASGADGKSVIAAVVLAYEIYHRLFDAARIRDKGWDHVFYTAVAGAAAAAKLRDLSQDRIGNAIALAITPNLALEVTRRGDLSMWKGCAAANAARNAAFAVELAAEGMTGPALAVEGEHGLWHAVGRFEIAPFDQPITRFRILDANLKYFLAEYHAQAPITAALVLAKEVNLEDIQKVLLYTYWFAWSEIGSEPEKWRPATRETADHSVPFMLSAALVDGQFSDAIFTEERLRDPRIHALIDKIEVKEDPEYTRAYPAVSPCRLEILMKDGQCKSVAVAYPLGHARNPMSDDDVTQKFRTLASRSLPTEKAESMLRDLWVFEKLPSTEFLYN